LEDALIALTKSNYAYAAIEALRKADTVKTREALAQIAINDGDLPLRIEAIRNLGRTNDETYLPVLMRLVESNNKQILNDAAEATGNLGGPKAVAQLATLVSSPDDRTRLAAANGLGETHARQAVSILVPMLLDSDVNVRQAAVSGLYVLTHHAALDSNQWADITNPESAASVHQRWVAWLDSHRKHIEIHGMADCAPPEPLD
jgi:HEAT repeat protein